VPLTPALLRLDPMFDPLRNDPRFQKLVACHAVASAKAGRLARAEELTFGYLLFGYSLSVAEQSAFLSSALSVCHVSRTAWPLRSIA